MTLSDWILVVNAFAVVVAAVAIGFGLYGVDSQLKMTTFLAYTDRYRKTMRKLPFAARERGSGFKLAELSNSDQEDVLSAYRDYFNICWEEWWLAGEDNRRLRNRIDWRTWNLWKGSIRQTMDFPDYDEIWERLKSEWEPYDDFVSFMSGLQIKGPHSHFGR